MRKQLGAKSPVCEINVAPFVDVVLVLLIVFMVLSPLADKEMSLRLLDQRAPIEAKPGEAMPSSQIVLTLLSNGRVLLDRQQMAVEEAMRFLHDAYQGQPSKVLFFNAVDAAMYGQAVLVLDQAHLAGVDTIALMTDALSPRVGSDDPLAPAGKGRKVKHGQTVRAAGEN